MRILILLLTTISLLISSCAERKMAKVTEFPLKNLPPNCVKISDNFYADQTEISNFHWLEYLHWNGHVFGKNSAEYQAAMPDTSVWSRIDSCAVVFDKNYLRHPAYRDYPVVGVSQSQAENFAKWRSDRVFEYILIKYKIIDRDTAQKPDTYFTIERFYAGKIERNDQNLAIDFYPEFRLPTLAEHQQILACADSLSNLIYNNNNNRKCNESCCNIETNVNYGKTLCLTDSTCADVLQPVFTKCANNKPYSYIHHLRGNVSEWLAEKDQSIGGNWSNSKEEILLDNLTISAEANAYKGFRCVAIWKKRTDINKST